MKLWKAYELNRVEEHFPEALHDTVKGILKMAPRDDAPLHKIVGHYVLSYTRHANLPGTPPASEMAELLWYHLLKQVTDGARERALKSGKVPVDVAEAFKSGGVRGLKYQIGEHLQATVKDGVMYVCGDPPPPVCGDPPPPVCGDPPPPVCGDPPPPVCGDPRSSCVFLSREEFRMLTSIE
jgi:hypothetical protein